MSILTDILFCHGDYPISSSCLHYRARIPPTQGPESRSRPPIAKRLASPPPPPALGSLAHARLGLSIEALVEEVFVIHDDAVSSSWMMAAGVSSATASRAIEANERLATREEEDTGRKALSLVDIWY
ncbi:MAG: hypothetical protein ETSY2_14085 [Candidatus Entotheonella gemina]|uniref:Uncharacterized protein n=1 Tax=Candidatus Entotheonella gemina TaxID=1429439 RepID=W4M9A4_9BACT|nr:MAG: hypothetical protein ETSY2_14085 [Candidatus Entotheonella gemina]